MTKENKIMKRFIQLLVGVVALTAITLSPVSAQEYGLRWTRGQKHITTKTTTNVTTATVVLHSILINVSGAGTSWTLTVQTQDTTPAILYTATVATGTTVIALPVGLAVKGLDLVTAGGTAGTMDVFYAYH
jgi:hypothetical protein